MPTPRSSSGPRAGPRRVTISVSDPILALVPRSPVYVQADTTLRETARTMADESVPVVLVRGPHGPAGIVSEADVEQAAAQGADLDRDRAGDLMTLDLATVDPRESVLSAAERILANDISHLVVTTPRTAVGVVSAPDVLAVLADASIEP